MSSTDGLTPQRIRTIALRRLKALGVQAYAVKERVYGRYVLPPGQLFESVEHLVLGEEHRFLVNDELQLEFMRPSPLRSLGPIAFIEAQTGEALRYLVASSWNRLCARLRSQLERARTYVPEAQLDPDGLEIRFEAADGRGSALLRFEEDATRIALVMLDAEPVETAADGAHPRLELPDELAMFDLRLVQRLVETEREARAARRLQHKQASGDIVLALGTADILGPPPSQPTPEVEPPVIHAPELEPIPLQDSLDLELPDDVSFEQLEATADVEPESLKERLPRCALEVEALLSWNDEVREVRILDINLGGVFAGMESTAGAPAPGDEVLLSGFGPYAARLRVAHVRSSAEAEILHSGAGLGLAFAMAPTEERRPTLQDAPGCLVLMKSSPARTRAIEAALDAGCVVTAVENGVAAGVMLHQLDVSLVLIDPAACGTDWRTLGEALGFGSQHIRAAVLLDEPPPELPEWASCWTIADLSAEAIRGLMAT